MSNVVLMNSTPPTGDSRPGVEGSSALSDSRLRSDLLWPSRTRVRAIREHAARMQHGVDFWERRGDAQEADRCRRALQWTWRELGLL
jgi:hypothetical protein